MNSVIKTKKLKLKDVINIIDNCESGILLNVNDIEELFFDGEYEGLKNKIKNNIKDITYKVSDKINDYKIKKIYFLFNNKQTTLEVI